MRKVSILFILLLLTILSFAVHLTILHINDTHGHAWAFSEWRNPNIGGFAYISTLVKQIRKEVESKGGHVLFLHAGDINTGVPESDLLDAEPDIVALSMMGLDAVVLGNHEFDNPRDVLLKQMHLASFPFLSCNFVKPNGELFTKPYIIKDFGDIKVAIIGVTTEETMILEPIYLEGAKFVNAVDSVKKYVEMLRDKVDLIVVLSHLGYGESEEPEKYTRDVDLAKKVDGIDVIVGGHTHTKFDKPPVVNGTIIVQAWEWGKQLGRLDLEVENGKIVSWSWKAIPVNLKKYLGKDKSGKKIYEYVSEEIHPDPAVYAVLKFYKEKGSEKLDEPVGETKIYLDGERAHVRSKDTNLAHLITDAMRWKTGADIALQNGGGIRASIQPGKITYRDILTVLPFGNTLYVMKLTGEQIMKVLEYAATIPDGKGAHLQTSGLTWVNDNGKPVDVKVNGEPIDLNKVYVVVTNNYMAGGGDGYTMLKEWSKNGYDTGFVLADVVKDYIKQLGVIEKYDETPRYVKK